MVEFPAMIELNRIHCGDCIEMLNKVQEPFADLIFADPPFNIGYKYDVYEDRKAYEEYYQWTHDWMDVCARKALKPAGSFWIAIGDEYAAEVRIIGRKLGLNLRNWVIWHYTFGQCTQMKFARSHAHLFYFTKETDPKKITFNDMAVRMPSARQTTYADRRANPKGKVPDDVWSFSRVCGTFCERVEWHPCQMPERVLERIVKVSSNPDDVVLDPFSGSGTTLAVAARLGRRYVGFDISESYVKNATQRIADTLAGRRPTTDISENPIEKRAERKVGGKGKKVRGPAAKKTEQMLFK
jgi:DNA modification methylase